MPAYGYVELKDLILKTDIGTYGPGDVVPDFHMLDMTLELSTRYILIEDDGMEHIFDYDPLIAEIERLAGEGHYETQERLMTRFVSACAAHSEIEGVEMCLRKGPVANKSGTLGMRVVVNGAEFEAFRGGAV